MINGQNILNTNIPRYNKSEGIMRHDMKCLRCGNTFKNANSWCLCCDCFVTYERDIPDHIPDAQKLQYLFRTIHPKGKHER